MGIQDFFEGGLNMHYEINVALDGVHLFAITERSAQTKYALDRILTIFKEKFPRYDGQISPNDIYSVIRRGRAWDACRTSPDDIQEDG